MTDGTRVRVLVRDNAGKVGTVCDYRDGKYLVLIDGQYFRYTEDELEVIDETC
jgi:hypothetical protein